MSPAAEPIAAVATAAGAAGIGVIRISGTQLGAFAQALTGRSPEPRHAHLVSFRDADGTTLDRGLLLYFPAPASYTGEDVLELHAHGGEAVLRLLLARCYALGARPAEPGEFSFRAYRNGKMDLAQAEAVADLIQAESAQAVRGAQASLRGDFSRRVRALGQSIEDWRVRVEGSIDFSDEDIDFLQGSFTAADLAPLTEDLDRLLADARQGELLNHGRGFALMGRPNVGKSSLLNRLVGEDVAIVTPIPGTTRDTVSARMTVDGVVFHLVDTAGVRDSPDPVEQLGIARSWQAAARATVVILVCDATAGITAEDQALRRALPGHCPVVTVMNKADLLAGAAEDASAVVDEGNAPLWISALTGEGIPALERRLLEVVGASPGGEAPFVARERHLRALGAARDALSLALAPGLALELVAEELRLAQRALGEITGEVTADHLLGEIFKRFCIGK